MDVGLAKFTLKVGCCEAVGITSNMLFFDNRFKKHEKSGGQLMIKQIIQELISMLSPDVQWFSFALIYDIHRSCMIGRFKVFVCCSY